MTTETELFGNVFDRLGRDVLEQLATLPANALHWPLPLPQRDSLFTRALRLVEESTFWVVEVVGEGHTLYDQQTGEISQGTFADLALYYERWFIELHQVLDSLPNTFLNIVVIVPPSYQALFGGKTTTVRACLLYSIEQSALNVGHIQLICQMFADGERVLQEVIEYQGIDG